MHVTCPAHLSINILLDAMKLTIVQFPPGMLSHFPLLSPNIPISTLLSQSVCVLSLHQDNKFLHNVCFSKSISCLIGNIERLPYRTQPVNAVWENICCSLWEPYGTHTLFQIIYKNAVRTSQETYYGSATKPNKLTLYRETAAVYCENHTEQTNRICGKNADIYNVKAGGTHSGHCDLKNHFSACIWEPQYLSQYSYGATGWMKTELVFNSGWDRDYIFLNRIQTDFGVRTKSYTFSAETASPGARSQGC
jgi:hypothetical protein